METVQRDYAPRGVRFYYIYKALAHPETNSYITPFTLDERLLHVAEAREKIGSRITWLCDSMSNAAKHALGDAPNSEFVIDPLGTIVRSRPWSRPEQLRADLEELLGKVDKPTAIADLDLPPLQPPQRAATGVVPRVQLPGRLMPVRVAPLSELGGDPFYAKLRTEVEPTYLQRGEGTLYLGFMLDPLYEVHWNNEAAPLSFRITAPDGIRVEPADGQGPAVNVKADADPREFLLQVSGRASEPLRLTATYMACDDAETFCKPVRQHYEITLRVDPDGGARRAPRPTRAPRTLSDATGPARSALLKQAVDIFRERDLDRDGQLDAIESSRIEDTVKELLRADQDQDGRVSLRELLDALQADADQ